MALLGQLLVGWLLADLLGGIFHWWQDRVGKESWPILGTWLIAPNRLHHAEPLVFAEGNFFDRSLASTNAALVFGAVCWWFFGLSVVLVTMIVGLAVATEVHRFTHEPRKANAILRVMQEIGVIQSPKGHARHHRPPQDSNFCPLTDWLNPILESLQVWPRLEWLLKITPVG